jgi:hypothetical protein
MMAKALAAEGMSLEHIIGPRTAHAYHPRAKDEINRRIDQIAAIGRDPTPRQIRFTTWTLRYNRVNWLQIDGLEQHWERARVDAALRGPDSVDLKTHNVSALSLDMQAGHCPLDGTLRPKVHIDGQEIETPPPLSDRSWSIHFRKDGQSWAVVQSADDGTSRKRHGLQGPIDDAFLDSFLMVSPTGTPLNERVGAWAKAEMAHAVEHWRKQFRGDARMKADTEVTSSDISDNNLALWGDPSSNKLLAKIVDKLPIRWNSEAIEVGSIHFDSASHVPLLIYPNPLNPKRYVVVNSGFTFREYDYLNNARQVPKLPDYAVLDVRSPVTSRAPGAIVAAGFFGERWELPGVQK